MKKDFLAFLKVHSHLRWRMLFLFFSCFANLHAQIITTIAGNGMPGYSGDGGQATAAKLFYVDMVAVDSSGNIYIGDRNWTVRKVNSAGIISTFAGIGDSSGFIGDGGPATKAKITYTLGIAFDKKGNVYISDNANKRVRKVDASGIITTFAGNGSSTISGDGGPATDAGLGGTKGICFDAIGNLYIAAEDQIKKVDTFGVITTYAGSTGGFSGDGSPATNAQIKGPAGIMIDKNGNLFICDVGNWRIRRINNSGIISTIAGNGTQGYSGDGIPATIAQFNSASGVFPDECGDVYIADYTNNVIRMVNESGFINTIAGNGFGRSTGSGGYSGDGGAATAAELYHPESIFLDKNGSVFIADEYNHCVRYIHIDSCRNTTDVPNVTNTHNIAIYPNPADAYITVTNPVDVAADRYSIKNVLGQVVLEGRIAAGDNDIDVRHLVAGNYIISAYKEDKPAGNTMFVKK